MAELFETDRDISTLFNPALMWVAVPSEQAVVEGWTYEAGRFASPVPIRPSDQPTLLDLQAQLQAISARIALLSQNS